MTDSLHDFLSRDHERLDALLLCCVRDDGTIDPHPYAEFRQGLLRHIAIEEKVLFPLLRKHRAVGAGPHGERPEPPPATIELESQLHRDHAALAALLVPPPTRAEIEKIRALLELHNPLEELPGGLYEVIEGLAAEEISALMEKVHAVPPVKLAPHADTPAVRSAIEKLIRDAETDRIEM